MTSLLLRYYSGSDVYELEALSVRVDESTEAQGNAEVTVAALDWIPIAGRLDPRLDVFEVLVDGVREASGRYADSQEEGDEVMLQVASWEEDARTAAPTSSTLAFVGVDDDVVARDAILRMPGLHVGTVESVAGRVSVEFPIRSPAGMLRSLARSAGAFVQYTPERTVNYAEELGRDRAASASQVLQEATPNTEGTVESLRVRHDTRIQPTHVLVLGAGEGTTQVQGVAVASSFSGGRQVWRRFEDSRIQTAAQARQEASTIAAEITALPDAVFVEAYGVTVSPRPMLGDRFRVRDLERGVDVVARVLRRIRRIDASKDSMELVLSNRRSLRV